MVNLAHSTCAFENEGILYFLLKELLQKGDFMCKIDVKDAYFSVPLHQHSEKLLKFKWKDSLYQFFCLCFGLSPTLMVFIKLMKTTISLLSKMNVCLIIFLNDILIMASSTEELTLST